MQNAVCDNGYRGWERLLHLGIAGFGITAFLSGELAEDGPGSGSWLLHAWLGLSLGICLLLRLAEGLVGREPMRFSSWSPFNRRQWALAADDLRSLRRLRLPERASHEGLAGLVQAFGLALFSWMAATGTLLFFANGAAFVDWVEELHAIGETLVPIYLGLHVGAVLLHSLAGDPVWQKMFLWRRRRSVAGD